MKLIRSETELCKTVLEKLNFKREEDDSCTKNNKYDD